MNIEDQKVNKLLGILERSGPLLSDLDGIRQEIRLRIRAHEFDKNPPEGWTERRRNQFYGKLTRALENVEAQMQEMLETPELAQGHQMHGYLDEIWKVREPEPGYQSPSLQHGLHVVASLRQAAHKAAQPREKKRGRPCNSSPLPAFTIAELALLYQGATGKKAGKGNGPFCRFVGAFAEAVNASVDVAEVIKNALRRFPVGPPRAH